MLVTILLQLLAIVGFVIAAVGVIALVTEYVQDVAADRRRARIRAELAEREKSDDWNWPPRQI